MVRALAKTWASRFVAENPNIAIGKREDYFDVKIDGVSHRVHNGEATFGPWQIWPAQIEGFALRVSEGYADKKINYQTLKGIILVEQEELLSRNYANPKEYEAVVARMFDATLIGMTNGKLRRVIGKKAEKIKDGLPTLARLFSREETRLKQAAEDPLIKNLIHNFQQQTPAYMDGVRTWGLQGANLAA